MDRKDIENNGVYRNKKNKELYRVLNNYIINATNANNDQEMVLYCRDDNRTGQKFVRDIDEFCIKFELA